MREHEEELRVEVLFLVGSGSLDELLAKQWAREAAEAAASATADDELED